MIYDRLYFHYNYSSKQSFQSLLHRTFSQKSGRLENLELAEIWNLFKNYLFATRAVLMLVKDVGEKIWEPNFKARRIFFYFQNAGLFLTNISLQHYNSRNEKCKRCKRRLWTCFLSRREKHYHTFEYHREIQSSRRFLRIEDRVIPYKFYRITYTIQHLNMLVFILWWSP